MGFSEIDITMTTINKKNFEIDKCLILPDLDQRPAAENLTLGT